MLLFKVESTDEKFVLFKFTLKSLKIKPKFCKKEDSKFSIKEIRYKKEGKKDKYKTEENTIIQFKYHSETHEGLTYNEL